MGSDDEFEQLAFADGRLVAADDVDPVRGGDPIAPDERSGYLLAIKSGAVEANQVVAAVRDDHGEAVSFGCRTEAEAFARQCSAEGGDLCVQAAAPNDPENVDGYLLAAYDRSIDEPASTDGRTWTFDVGASLYGALGEAVITTGSPPPALAHFVRRDLGLDEDADLRIEVTDGEYLSVDGHDWIPDCRVEARRGWDGEVLETYWCEAKTGNASFERSQRDAMRALAATERVLKIRVLIDELPDQYSVRIYDVEPAEG